MNMERLIKEAHANAVKHGFWADPEQRDVATKIALIHSELSEALEEFRLSNAERGGGLGEILYACTVTRHRQREAICHELGGGTLHKPEGFVVELADAAIRIFDLAGWMGWKLNKATGYAIAGLVPAKLAHLHRDVSDLFVILNGLQASMIICQLDKLAKKVGGDLWQAIDVKMAFNTTRPIKHGKRI